MKYTRARPRLEEVHDRETEQLHGVKLKNQPQKKKKNQAGWRPRDWIGFLKREREREKAFKYILDATRRTPIIGQVPYS